MSKGPRLAAATRSAAVSPGLGPRSRAWLAAVGIASLDEVRRIGAVEAYRRVKRAFPRQVSWNLLYGLHAAIDGVRWSDYPEAVRARMRAEVGGAEADPRPTRR